eukprot:3338795-Rhodomonas_salina.4
MVLRTLVLTSGYGARTLVLTRSSPRGRNSPSPRPTPSPGEKRAHNRLRVCYAMSGIDVVYGAIAHSAIRYAMSGAEIAHVTRPQIAPDVGGKKRPGAFAVQKCAYPTRMAGLRLTRGGVCAYLMGRTVLTKRASTVTVRRPVLTGGMVLPGPVSGLLSRSRDAVRRESSREEYERRT